MPWFSRTDLQLKRKTSIRRQRKTAKNDSIQSRIPGSRQRQQKSNKIRTNSICTTLCVHEGNLWPPIKSMVVGLWQNHHPDWSWIHPGSLEKPLPKPSQQSYWKTCERPPQLPAWHWMSLPPTLKEAHCFMKSGKAAISNNMPLEFFSHGRLELKTQLMLLIHKIWEIKQSLRTLKMPTLWQKKKKRKKDCLHCGNYHSIPLLSITYKTCTNITE